MENAYKLLEQQKHKFSTAQETIESLMRFPDTSLGEDDNQICNLLINIFIILALASPKFDQLIQEFVKGNNLRILVLETKNEEYRSLRIQHGYLFTLFNYIS